MNSSKSPTTSDNSNGQSPQQPPSRDQPYAEGNTPGVQEPGEDVTSRAVGAKEVLSAWRAFQEVNVVLVGVVEGNQRGQHSHSTKQRQNGDSEEGQLVAAEPPPGGLAGLARNSGELNCDVRAIDLARRWRLSGGSTSTTAGGRSRCCERIRPQCDSDTLRRRPS